MLSNVSDELIWHCPLLMWTREVKIVFCFQMMITKTTETIVAAILKMVTKVGCGGGGNGGDDDDDDDDGATVL